MRILQLCNKPPYPPYDGGSLAMLGLAEGLKKNGHQLTVLTLSTLKHPLSPNDLTDFRKLMDVELFQMDTSVKPAELLYNLLFSHTPYTASRFYSSLFEEKIIQHLQANEYDIIQLEGVYLTDYISAIRKNSTALISLRAHNVEHEIWQRIVKQEKNPLKKSYFSILSKRIRKYEIQMLNTYDVLVPITDRDMKKFNEMGNLKPAHAAVAGIRTTHADYSIPEAFSLFFIGSLDWIPNQEGLLWFLENVFRDLHLVHPHLNFHIAGRNASADLLRKLSVPGVIFHGQVRDSAAFLTDHSLLVAPCFSGSGMRMKIVESMASGRPVLTTSIGAEGILAANGEEIFLAETAADFYGIIERLMNNRDICRTAGKKAKIFAEKNFDNTKIAALLTDFYNSHLG